MQTTTQIKKLGLLAAVPLAAVGVWGGALAFGGAGGSASPATLTAATQQAPGPTQANDFITKLAGHLGVDEQTLRDALRATSLDEVDQAQAAGKLTQAQADDIRSRINSGDQLLFGLGGPGGPGGHERGGHGPGVDTDALASFLSVDAQTLRSDLEGGKTLAQEAQDHGKSRDDLKSFLADQFNVSIDADVQAGRLTAQQAADKKSAFQDNLDARIDSTRPADGPHGHHDAPPAQGSGSD